MRPRFLLLPAVILAGFVSCPVAQATPSPQSAAATARAAVGRSPAAVEALFAAWRVRLASICPDYAAARRSDKAWSCVLPDPGSASTTQSADGSGNAALQADSVSGQGHVPIIDCKPQTPYHCYVSKFVEFGVGIFPLGIAHIEANTNFNGLESQNGVATTLLTQGEPKGAALKQAWLIDCALARPSGPRQSCGSKDKAEPDYNTRRGTFEANFYYTIGRFAYTINDTFYGKFKPGPNPPGAPNGFTLARVYGYPVICYRAGTRKHPIKRCSFALFGEQL